MTDPAPAQAVRDRQRTREQTLSAGTVPLYESFGKDPKGPPAGPGQKAAGFPFPVSGPQTPFPPGLQGEG